MFAIEIENLYKSYDDFEVLRGLTMRVPTGQVYGLLGPNGSGKSTLIHLILGFLKPTKGRLRLLGSANLEQVHSRVGYLPERLRYHMRYTAREYLRYLGQFSDCSRATLKDRVEQELRVVGLLDVADRMLNTYSKGMLQRFGIAQALLADPEILLIDEPTSGLDPAGQREMVDLLSDLRSRGHTIFLTTHVLGEIEQLCDLVGVLFDGKLAAEVGMAELRAPSQNVRIRVDNLPEGLVLRLQGIASAVQCSEREVLLQPNSPALQAKVLRMLLDAEIQILALAPQGRPIESLYLQIVRGELVTPEPAVPAGATARPADVSAPDSDSGNTLLQQLLTSDEQPRDAAESEKET